MDESSGEQPDVDLLASSVPVMGGWVRAETQRVRYGAW